MVAARQLARKFTLYGCAGWVLEVLFTGTKAALSKDKKLAARTYLWMHPIYGAAGLTLEALHRRLANRSRMTRALASLGVIYATEYAACWATAPGGTGTVCTCTGSCGSTTRPSGSRQRSGSSGSAMVSRLRRLAPPPARG